MVADVVKKSFNNHLKILTITGLYMPENFNEYSYQIYARLMYFSITVFFPMLCCIQLLMDIRNSNIFNIIDSSFVAIELSISIFKHYPFVFKQKQIIELLNELKKDPFKVHHPHLLKYEKNTVHICTLIFNLFFYYSFPCLVLWIVRPLFVNEINFPVNIPLPKICSENTILYILSYGYISFSASFLVLGELAVDPFLAGLFCQITGQIQILKHKLQHADRLAELYLNQKNQNEDTNEIIDQLLKHCVFHHQQIISYTNRMEELFSISYFSITVTSSLMICLSCFEILLIDPRSMYINLFSIIYYVSCAFGGIFLYCATANEVYNESLTINEAIMLSNWHKYDVKARKTLMVLMEITKKPLMIKAGSLVPLTLDTFLKVSQKAYSFLTVLQSLK